jgi:hypothetical protein
VPEQPGPIGLGSRIREVHRAPGGTEFAELVEVVDFRFRVYGQPTGVMRLAQPVLRPMMKRSFAGCCATLKRVLENAWFEP